MLPLVQKVKRSKQEKDTPEDAARFAKRAPLAFFPGSCIYARSVRDMYSTIKWTSNRLLSISTVTVSELAAHECKNGRDVIRSTRCM
jgi:hypothetical protein